jgi:hypothetical protein
MKEVFQALGSAGLPTWLFWTIMLAAGIWFALPRIREFLPWRRFYEKEKMRLELSKLFYEIEALKKTNELQDVASPYGHPIEDVSEFEELRSQHVERTEPPNRLVQGLFGGLGAAVLSVLTMVQIGMAWNAEGIGGRVILTASAILIGAGAVSAAALRTGRPKTSFLVGLIVTLLISQVLSVVYQGSLNSRERERQLDLPIIPFEGTNLR